MEQDFWKKKLKYFIVEHPFLMGVILKKKFIHLQRD